jgi:hypothetical protein
MENTASSRAPAVADRQSKVKRRRDCHVAVTISHASTAPSSGSTRKIRSRDPVRVIGGSVDFGAAAPEQISLCSSAHCSHIKRGLGVHRLWKVPMAVSDSAHERSSPKLAAGTPAARVRRQQDRRATRRRHAHRGRGARSCIPVRIDNRLGAFLTLSSGRAEKGRQQSTPAAEV